MNNTWRLTPLQNRRRTHFGETHFSRNASHNPPFLIPVAFLIAARPPLRYRFAHFRDRAICCRASIKDVTLNSGSFDSDSTTGV